MLWHYEFANGEYVSLSTMGLKDAVYSEIASNVIQKLANKIDSDIQKTVKNASWDSGNSSIYKNFSVGHHFGQQPLDLDNDWWPDVETGTPYEYGATWANQSIQDKLGTIYA